MFFCRNRIIKCIWPFHHCSSRFYASSTSQFTTDSSRDIPLIGDRNTERLLGAVKDLRNNASNAVWLLKIRYSNAHHSVGFSRAYCEVESTANNPEAPEIFSFGGLFQSGLDLVQCFLEQEKILPSATILEITGLKRLFAFLQRETDLGSVLRRKSEEAKCEIQWSAALAQYLLKDLAVHPKYILNQNSVKELVTMKKEFMDVEFGDTSIGNQLVWHGCADILIGREHFVQVKVDGGSNYFDKETAETEDESLNFDITTNSLYHQNSQILSQALVFGLLQKKLYPHLSTFVPTVRVSREEVIFYFYDPENDMLIESSIFDLFEQNKTRQELSYDTVLALWLTLNYRYFSTGVTQCMLDKKDFTANFLTHLPSEVRDIYRNRLRFGETLDQKPRNPLVIKFKGSSNVHFHSA